MNFFQNIKLENYRNFKLFEANFTSGCNIFFGDNGSGKTNILESLSLFSKGRGIRKDNIKNFVNRNENENHFIVSSDFFNENDILKIKVTNNNENKSALKKIFVNDDSSNESISYFDNLFSQIYFLPEMERLFLNSPTMRRNFFDRLIFSVDKNYNKIINQYKNNIYERNKILKSSNIDTDWINNIENNIVDLGLQIYSKRSDHISVINDNLQNLNLIKSKIYKFNLEIVDELFCFEKNINIIREEFITKLRENREIDRLLGGSKLGPHKSDIIGKNFLDSFNLRHLSTGQQKTTILLIIIAHCDYLIKTIKRSPILLFDEVCSHLDNENRNLLLNLIELLNVQIFMTGTEKKFFSFLSTKANYCNIT